MKIHGVRDDALSKSFVFRSSGAITRIQVPLSRKRIKRIVEEACLKLERENDGAHILLVDSVVVKPYQVALRVSEMAILRLWLSDKEGYFDNSHHS